MTIDWRATMHTPATTPRPSIYYRYQVHAPWLPAEGQPPQAHPVVIVGAGPAGLVTALELARLGVAECGAECSELQVSLGSRAIAFTRRSLEILQQVGVAERITAQGLPWRFGNSFYRGEQVFRMEAPHDPDDRFWPMTNIQQQFLEEYLADACEASPLVDLRWGNRCTGVQPAAEGARVQVDTPAGPYGIEAQWVIAADGGRSEIRSALGLQLEGDAYEASSSSPTSGSTCRCPPNAARTSTPTGTRATRC
jgi:3-(3-hydroxy-phenyl)propionate hydroxylase